MNNSNDQVFTNLNGCFVPISPDLYFDPYLISYYQSNQGLYLPPATSVRLCPVDRPCIRAVYNERANLIVEWSDTESRDRYNLRWSRPGKPVKQLEIHGGRGGRFVLRNFRPNTRYTFAVQGCRKPLIGRSKCTPWYEETVLSCGARWNPCR